MRFLKAALFGGMVTLVISCSTKAYLKRGDACYESGRYTLAGKMYEKAYKKAKNKELHAPVALKIGNTLDVINKSRKATVWYRRALTKQDTFPDAHLSLALAELKNQQLENAEKDLLEFQKRYPENKKGETGLSTLNRIGEWVSNPTRYTVSPLEHLNSSHSDFGAVYMAQDTNTILFSSTRKQKPKRRVDKVTGDKFSHIFESHYSNEVKKEVWKKRGKKRRKTGEIRIVKTDKYSWSRPNILDDTINSRFHEGGICFNTKGDFMFFTSTRKLKNYNLGAKIYSAKKQGKGWGDVSPLRLADDTLSVGHPSLSADGQYLYFVSDMPGGIGGNDIWVAKKEGNQWGAPVNLGKRINTPGNEIFPFIRENGVLFFASDTHPGMGGLDIFRAKKKETGDWEVENMKYPINSPADDFGIVFQPGKEKGMFTSSRQRGNDDIYRFDFIPIIFSYEGEVKNSDGDSNLSDATIHITSSLGEQIELKTDEKGRFNFTLKAEVEYILMVSKEEFLNGKDQVSTIGMEDSHTFSGIIYLKPIEKPIELPNIFYDFADWKLREESKTALDELVETMNDNPGITIELGSHTDRIGTTAANRELSQKRAQAVVDYLIDKGVFWDRLEAKGYGETMPKTVDGKLAMKHEFLQEGDVLNEAYISKLDSLQQEIANQINRRTEFRVLSTKYKPGPNSKTRPISVLKKTKDVLIKDLKKIKGLFYTVQLGVYDKKESPEIIRQFKVVFRDEMGHSSYRYTCYIFDRYEEAVAKAREISHKGIKASVVAYSNGKEIPIEEAKEMER